MGLQTYALTTVSRTKDFLAVNNNSLDTVIERLINAISDTVQSYCHRNFLLQTYTNEEYNGYGTGSLSLKNAPIVTTSQAVVLAERASTQNVSNWVTLDSNLYFVQAEAGVLQTSGWKFFDLPLHYRVTYAAGYDYDQATKTLESIGLGDLEEAVWKLVGAEVYDRKSNPRVESETIGNYSVRFRRKLNEDDWITGILDGFVRHTFL